MKLKHEHVYGLSNHWKLIAVVHSHSNILFGMSSQQTSDTVSIIRKLPKSVDPFKWMFGLEIVFGLKPFKSILKIPKSHKTDLRISNTSLSLRPRTVSAVSFWGMLFYLLNSIFYFTSIGMWWFTDIYSLVENPIGFMDSDFTIVYMVILGILLLIYNSNIYILYRYRFPLCI